MPRPLSEAARQKAIDATIAILGGDGIEGFSIEAVTRQSGVAKTTIYRHWSSANELLVDALDCHIETVAAPDTGSLRGDLEAMTTAALEVMAQPARRRMLLDLLSAAAADPDLEEIKQALVAERTQPIVEIVERAVDRGEIPPIEPERAITFVHGPLMARTMLQGEPPGAEELPELIDLIMRGLGADPSVG
ncbi:MAG: TetR/AcrR family transcriptional regulator [Actinomycetota bacterium]